MKNSPPQKSYSRRTALSVAAGAIGLAATNAEAAETARPVVHFEIGCRDLAKTQQFFGDLFGWKMQQTGPAALIDAAERGIAGHMTALGHEPQHYTIFYVEVDNVQAYLDKAKSLGGKTLVPPINIPTGMFAWFEDPEGNTIGLLKTKK